MSSLTQSEFEEYIQDNNIEENHENHEECEDEYNDNQNLDINQGKGKEFRKTSFT